MAKEVKSVPSDNPNDYCRLCFSNRNLVALLHSNEPPLQDLLDAISICTGIQIEANDSRPCSICWRCAVAVEDFHLFRKQSLVNDAIIRNKYSSTTVRQGQDEWLISIPVFERSLDLNDYKTEVKPQLEAVMLQSDDSNNSCDKLPSKEEMDVLSTQNSQSTQSLTPACRLCSQTFTSRQTLYVHIREQHSGDRRRYKCEVCQSSFKRKGHLDDHMSSHTGECRYTCKHCEAKFARPKTLMRHRKTCGKERTLIIKPLHRPPPFTETQFQCEYCPKSFKHRPSLNFHIKSHYALLPYACKLCDARFANDKGLLIHNGKYHPNTLNEGTSTLPAFVKQETGIRCTLCPRRFKEQRYLNQHIKFIHSQKDDDQKEQETGVLGMVEECVQEQDQGDTGAVTIKFEVEDNDAMNEEIISQDV